MAAHGARPVPPVATTPSVTTSSGRDTYLDGPLSPLTEESGSDLSPSDTSVGPLSSAVVDLVISKHTHLAIRSNTRHDPADPTYDLSVPPATYDEAVRRSDAPRWRAAMDKEIEQLRSMNVYSLVPLPPGGHAIGSHWVLEYKEGDGKGGPVEKARPFCCQGVHSCTRQRFQTDVRTCREAELHLTSCRYCR